MKRVSHSNKYKFHSHKKKEEIKSGKWNKRKVSWIRKQAAAFFNKILCFFGSFIKKIENLFNFSKKTNLKNKKIKISFGNGIIGKINSLKNQILINLNLKKENKSNEEESNYDVNKLVQSSKQTKKEEFDWSLNLALLNEAEKKSEDPKIKEHIQFLKANYLHKIAPISDSGEMDFKQREKQSHGYARSFYQDSAYKKVGERFNKKLGFGNKGIFVPIDTLEIDHMLPLSHYVIQSSKQDFSKDVAKILGNKFKRKNRNLDKTLKGNLGKNRLLFDLTSDLQNSILTSGEPTKEIEFSKKFKKIEKRINRELNQAVHEFIDKNQIEDNSENQAKIKEWLKNNSICLCRIQVDEVPGVKFLPLFTKKVKFKSDDSLFRILGRPGLTMGAVNRIRFFEENSSLGEKISYGVKGKELKNLNKIQFYKKDGIIKLNTFKSLQEKIKAIDPSQKEDKKREGIKVLGQGTLNLLRGFSKEVSKGKWEKLLKNPVTATIIEFSYYRIANHLANANLFIHDFDKFASEIELIHYELSKLLELSQPFSKDDFSQVYKKSLKIIPSELKPYLSSGLGKTAVNTSSAVIATINKAVKNPVKICNDNFYFEQIYLFDQKDRFKKVMKEKSIQKVDLYASSFSSNVHIDPSVTHYSFRNVEKDLKEIFKKKPETKSLTALIDVTMDLKNSDNVKKLLKSFSSEIKEGKINFIFFRSGQKFDIMGMDNYYGSPFYMLNNGDKKWDAFKILGNHPAHSTDILSNQWYSLSNKYGSEEVDYYRKQIFDNARTIIKKLPKNVLAVKGKPQKNISVCTIDEKMSASFIDIKINMKNSEKIGDEAKDLFFKILKEEGVKGHERMSLGFFNANFNLIPYDKDSATIRINPGINPGDNRAIIRFIEEVKKLETKYQ